MASDTEFRLTELCEFSAVELYIMSKCKSNTGFMGMRYDIMKRLRKLPEYNKDENGYMHPMDSLRAKLPYRTRYTMNDPFSSHRVGRGFIGINTTIPVSDYMTFMFPYPRCVNDKQMYYKLIGKTGMALALWRMGQNFVMSTKSNDRSHCCAVADFILMYGNKIVMVKCRNPNNVCDALFAKARASQNINLAKRYDKEHPSIYYDIYKYIDIEEL